MNHFWLTNEKARENYRLDLRCFVPCVNNRTCYRVDRLSRFVREAKIGKSCAWSVQWQIRKCRFSFNSRGSQVLSSDLNNSFSHVHCWPNSSTTKIRKNQISWFNARKMPRKSDLSKTGLIKYPIVLIARILQTWPKNLIWSNTKFSIYVAG